MHVRKAVEKIKDGIIQKLTDYLNTGKPPQNPSKLYVEAYAEVVNIADKLAQPQQAYQLYVTTLHVFVQDKFSQLQPLPADQLLSSFLKTWENYKMLVFWMYKVFLYLDKYYIRNKKKDHDLSVNYLAYEGLLQFQRELFLPLADRLKDAVLRLIWREREGEMVWMDEVKSLLMCFVQVGLTDVEIIKIHDDQRNEDTILWRGTANYSHYETHFESHFLLQTKAYYRSKTKTWVSEMTCPEYLARAYAALEEESRRAERYLDPKTRALLLESVESEIIAEHAAALADMPETGALDLLKNNRKTDLTLMFKVFRRVDASLNHITAKLSAYIDGRGRTLIGDQQLQSDAQEFSCALLKLKSEIDHLLEVCFENHSKFQRCRDLAFQSFLNLSPNSPLHIASFIDYEMKTGFRGLPETEVEQRLSSLISLVVCLSDRDIFINHYTHLLANRLLNGKSVSDEAEKLMIGKLSLECGHSMVRRITSMFQDISNSKDLNVTFQKLTKDTTLTVNILKTGCWPSQKKLECPLAEELRVYSRRFEDFYLSHHSGRSLNWLMAYGHVELATLYTPRKFTLVVSPAQAYILLLFNTCSSLTLATLQQLTNLSAHAIDRQLSKPINRFRVLNKQSKGKAIEESDVLTLNQNFSSTTFRVSMLPTLKLDKSEDKAKEDSEVLNMRKHVLDSVLVRIMKSRKTVKHTELLTEVMRQVNTFSPQPSMIKEQIESLIHREYIARTEKDHTVYVYLP